MNSDTLSYIIKFSGVQAVRELGRTCRSLWELVEILLAHPRFFRIPYRDLDPLTALNFNITGWFKNYCTKRMFLEFKHGLWDRIVDGWTIDYSTVLRNAVIAFRYHEPRRYAVQKRIENYSECRYRYLSCEKSLNWYVDMLDPLSKDGSAELLSLDSWSRENRVWLCEKIRWIIECRWNESFGCRFGTTLSNLETVLTPELVHRITKPLDPNRIIHPKILKNIFVFNDPIRVFEHINKPTEMFGYMKFRKDWRSVQTVELIKWGLQQLGSELIWLIDNNAVINHFDILYSEYPDIMGQWFHHHENIRPHSLCYYENFPGEPENINALYLRAESWEELDRIRKRFPEPERFQINQGLYTYVGLEYAISTGRYEPGNISVSCDKRSTNILLKYIPKPFKSHDVIIWGKYPELFDRYKNEIFGYKSLTSTLCMVDNDNLLDWLFRQPNCPEIRKLFKLMILRTECHWKIIQVAVSDFNIQFTPKEMSEMDNWSRLAIGVYTGKY